MKYLTTILVLDIKVLLSTERFFIMKITISLPDSTNIMDVSIYDGISYGITKGWSHLPVNIQKIVEWVGVDFCLMETYNVCITIKIRKYPVLNDLNEFSKTFHIDRYHSELISDIPQNFRKWVLEMVEEMIKHNKKQLVNLENLLK